MDTDNSVNRIIELVSQYNLTYDDKVKFKNQEPPRPDLLISVLETNKKTNKSVTRKFNRRSYDVANWLCGCNVRNAFFCYVCLIINAPESDPAWILRGINDVKHLHEKVKRHKLSARHLNNFVEFSTLGKINIMCQLNSADRLNIIEHNENVRKNRHILGKIIDCIKFCDMFEIALWGHDENKTSANARIFPGLINLMAEIDSVLQQHIQETNNRIFMGLSKTIQNELLDSIYAVCRSLILSEISETSYIAIQADETTDSATLSQLVFIVRYELNGQIHERFMGFMTTEDHTADGISKIILKELETIKIHQNPEKLIAQSYDGASVMCERNNGVQGKIKNVYKNAYFIHCYAHHLNLVIERAASQSKQVRIFFCNLEGFSTFFSRSSKRTAVLHEVVKKRLPETAPTNWSFKTQYVTTVYRHKKDIITCLDQIIDDHTNDQSTVRKAIGLRNTLKDYDFNYWLYFFNKIMPNVDVLFNQLQHREIDSIKLQTYVLTFKATIQHIRISTDYDYYAEHTDDEEENLQQHKRPRFEDENKTGAKEVCDVIVTNINDRFAFTDHLSIAVLFQPNLFVSYRQDFPETEFQMAIKMFNLDATVLKHELAVIYNRPDFEGAAGALTLLQCFYENNLSDAFVESFKLLKIICTMPMMSTESERCISTLKKIKTFARNTTQDSRRCALAMCAIEKKLLTATPNFNELVIEHFAQQKERRMNFIFKHINESKSYV